MNSLVARYPNRLNGNGVRILNAGLKIESRAFFQRKFYVHNKPESNITFNSSKSDQNLISFYNIYRVKAATFIQEY